MMFLRGTPSLTSRFRQASAAAPAPEVTSLTFVMSLPATFRPLSSAAPTTMAVPCWSSWKTGNLHALAQLALDVEAVRRLDVFQVDAAEGGLQRGDHVDQLVEVVLVDLEVEDVDAGELLEQHRLAFHHRLGRQRADVAQAQHRRAVGDDGHQVAARGVAVGVALVGDDLFAGRRHAGRIGQRQVVLVDQLLGRGDRDLARRRELVVFERGAAQLGAFGFLGRHGGVLGWWEVAAAGRR